MPKRIHNFNPGPAILPFSVLEEASKGLLELENCGMSVLEVSHRFKEYETIHAETQKDMLEIMGLGDDYKVLFLGGGASLQFTMIPMNFLSKDKTADYVNTGTWAKGAIKEAKLFGNVNIAATSDDKKYTYIPKTFKWSDNSVYAHITTNNTIEGTQFHFTPEVKTHLFADMSSDILSMKRDFSKYSLIYAGAQKNLGPAGVTLIILKKSLIDQINQNLSTMLSYKTHVYKDSLNNTPPVFPVYVTGLVLKWIKSKGGLKEIEKLNRKKAELLYSCIDEFSEYYRCPVMKEDRSIMNVVFRLPSEELENKFIYEARIRNLFGLKGHRDVGGIRASIYNAFPYEGVEALVNFMKEFKNKYPA